MFEGFERARIATSGAEIELVHGGSGRGFVGHGFGVLATWRERASDVSGQAIDCGRFARGDPSTHFLNSVCHTTAPRGSRLGAWRAVMPRGITSGARRRPGASGALADAPGIAGARPPTEGTGKAVPWHTKS